MQIENKMFKVFPESC